MIDSDRLLTAEEFWAIPDFPDRRFELISGRMVEYPISGGVKGFINRNFDDVVHRFVKERHMGHVYGDGVGYIVARNPDSVRVFDLTFVPRWRFAETGIPDSFWPFAPDFLVEIVATVDDPEAARRRVEAGLAAGTKLAWIASIAHRSVTVLTADGDIATLGPDDLLDGGRVLPGLRASISDLFNLDERP